MHGLGNAFKLCGGWPDEVMPELKATLSTGEEAEQGVSFRLQVRWRSKFLALARVSLALVAPTSSPSSQPQLSQLSPW